VASTPDGLTVTSNSGLTLPRGTKLQILDLGELRADEAHFFRYTSTASASNPHPHHDWRTLKMISALIEHPKHGLLLYEVGGGPNPDTQWGEAMLEYFPVTYSDANRLDRAIAAAGHDIKDIQGVIVGHLHPDHAGGLEYFRGTDVPIYAHEHEIKHAFYAAATNEDFGYSTDWLDVGLNWEPISEGHVELFGGLELLHTPGHTPGLMGLLLELDNTGPLYFASDQLIFEEHLDGQPLGWTMRDDHAWHDSRRRIKRFTRSREARIVFGHDPVNFERFPPSPHVFD
jgi:glyoxylase-like metal-dependent hydrolase (beta-lactamase superfamily II)